MKALLAALVAIGVGVGVPTGVEVHAEDIIYDGNFGAGFLSENVVTLDFASQRIWTMPR